MTSQDEITRTADRLKDALGAAGDLMTAGDSTVRGAAADVISSGDGLVRIRAPHIGHAWKSLVPLTAAASVVAIALAAAFVSHPAGNTGGRTVTGDAPRTARSQNGAAWGSAHDLAASVRNPGLRRFAALTESGCAVVTRRSPHRFLRVRRGRTSRDKLTTFSR
jgi:hypothetical protein